MRIHDLMKRDVVACSPATSLHDAVGLMVDRDCGFLPVVDGVVIGVLTDRDVALAAWRHGSPIQRLSVAAAMSSKAVVVVDEDTVERAEELMRAAGVHRLPVVDAGGLLRGVISLGDIARAPRRGAGSSHRDDVVATLSAHKRR